MGGKRGSFSSGKVFNIETFVFDFGPMLGFGFTVGFGPMFGFGPIVGFDPHIGFGDIIGCAVILDGIAWWSVKGLIFSVDFASILGLFTGLLLILFLLSRLKVQVGLGPDGMEEGLGRRFDGFGDAGVEEDLSESHTAGVLTTVGPGHGFLSGSGLELGLDQGLGWSHMRG